MFATQLCQSDHRERSDEALRPAHTVSRGRGLIQPSSASFLTSYTLTSSQLISFSIYLSLSLSFSNFREFLAVIPLFCHVIQMGIPCCHLHCFAVWFRWEFLYWHCTVLPCDSDGNFLLSFHCSAVWFRWESPTGWLRCGMTRPMLLSRLSLSSRVACSSICFSLGSRFSSLLHSTSTPFLAFLSLYIYPFFIFIFLIRLSVVPINIVLFMLLREHHPGMLSFIAFLITLD